MAQVPDFLLMHCLNTDAKDCATCGREFLIPLSGIAGFQRAPDGTVIVYSKRDWIGTHECVSRGRRFRTTTAWNDLLLILDGAVTSLVNVTVQEQA